MQTPQDIIQQLIANSQGRRPALSIDYNAIQNNDARNAAAAGLGIENFFKARQGVMDRQAMRQNMADWRAKQDAIGGSLPQPAAPAAPAPQPTPAPMPSVMPPEGQSRFEPQQMPGARPQIPVGLNPWDKRNMYR